MTGNPSNVRNVFDQIAETANACKRLLADCESSIGDDGGAYLQAVRKLTREAKEAFSEAGTKASGAALLVAILSDHVAEQGQRAGETAPTPAGPLHTAAQLLESGSDASRVQGQVIGDLSRAIEQMDEQSALTLQSDLAELLQLWQRLGHKYSSASAKMLALADRPDG